MDGPAPQRSVPASGGNVAGRPLPPPVRLRAAAGDGAPHRVVPRPREADERFRALVHHSFDAIVVSDSGNVITYATPAIRTMFGWDPDDLVGISGFDFVHPADRAASVERAHDLLDRPGGASLQTFRLAHADGRYRWVECTSVNLLDHDHVHGILHTFRDITERKQAEDLGRANEERLEALLLHADGAVLIVDPLGRITWASPRAGELWGLPERDLMGRALTDLLHDEDRREVVRRFTTLVAGPDGASARLEGRMLHGDGSWRWYESIFTNRLEEPSVQGIVANVRDTTDRAMHEQALRLSERRMEHQATHDPLTELPNRTLLHDRMQTACSRAGRQGRGVGVLFCDIDHFKVVNDSRGHSHGDALLVDVARRLVATARPGDTIARFGGDEFVVLAEDLPGPEAAVALADRLAVALADPFVVDGAEVVISLSTGIAFTTDPAADVEVLLRNADAAMYEAKASGRAQAFVFDDQLRTRVVERHQIEGSLRRAVGRRQLQVHHQPVVDLRTGAIVGTEALVRWKHPTRGMLHPATFISVAEETGLIVPLGAWVLDQATTQTMGWRAHLGCDDLFVAVNLSARQLADASLVTDIASVLAASRLDPGHLQLEVTESVLMRDAEASVEILERLHVLGVRLAIDDFGTGYSSFSYLRRFPVDILKIDRSFVQELETDPDAVAIVEAIVNLGHTLGLELVAEGVETPGQAAVLRRLGCDLAQGYLFARPLPPRLVRARLEAPTGRTGPV